MENRDRDKISRNTGSTPAGDVNRSTSSNLDRETSVSAEFGKKIGQSEEEWGNESSRHSGTSGSSGMKSGGGRSSGSSGLGDNGRVGSSGGSSVSDRDREPDRSRGGNESL